ncbi:MAG: N-6 DNA methylase [Planctomycetia bacterium]|nr:N-6 DNA methylase [Planctomycetia bacterium]
MPVEAKPLFRPDVLRAHLDAFPLPGHVDAFRPKLAHWADLLASGKASGFKEQEILPDFLTDFFCELLGYTRPADGGTRYTISREKHVQVEGEFADAVLGDFGGSADKFIVALEGKGPKDPLDRPFGGRRMSAVDQGYRYAINLPCDWILVTSIRQTRLYGKATDQQTYERFDTQELAESDAVLKRFVFLLGAARVVPESGRCHFHDLLAESERVGKDLTKKFYVAYANMRQDAFGRLCRDNPGVPRHDVLACAQKLLDRVLFCAFCEHRGLLPTETIRKAYEHRDPYHPRPIWDNFRGLFGAINLGNAGLGIHAYNGGLFADDPLLDGLTVADEVCAYFRDLGDFDYRPAHQAAYAPAGGNRRLIDVDILGHIFEQSITDLEKLRNEIDLPSPSGKGAGGEGDLPSLSGKGATARRKKEGAFYTPAFITRYIIEQALGGVLADRFEQLRQAHERSAKGSARAALADPRVYAVEKLKKPERAALVRFWEAWQDDLATVRLLDPACGSGAFLIEAFDQLHAAYQASNDRLEEVRGHRTLFDLDKRILENNLYGVDLNEEAIEICRLSLWIKTAERGKALTSLDHTIRVGNSIVADPAYCPKAFDWQAAFPEVFTPRPLAGEGPGVRAVSSRPRSGKGAGGEGFPGGFDVVVANPPYIRQEWLAPYKPHFEAAFKSYNGTADIFTYFFERGLQLLRDGGRLAFITSGSWVRANFAAPLRKVIAESTAIESMIDFGEFQPFEDAEMIRPTITMIRKQPPGPPMRLFKWLEAGPPPENLSEVIASAATMRTDHLGGHAWELDSDEVLALRKKLASAGTRLKDFSAGDMYRGIVTGLNEVFVIDSAERASLIQQDPRSEEVIKPFVQGTHLRPWYIEESRQYLIFARRGVCIEQYPAVLEYLQSHRESLQPRPANWPASKKWPGRKPGIYGWYEIQDSVDYWESFEQPKIVWPDISKLPRFSMDKKGRYLGNTAYIIPGGDYYLLGILASWTTWFYISKTSQPLRLRAGRWQYRLFAQFMEEIPIPNAERGDRKAIATLAQRCCDLGAARYDVQSAVRRRIIQTFGEGRGTLNTKAESWWELSLGELGTALKASFKLPASPFKNPRVADDWEPYLDEKRVEVASLTKQLADAEAELNDRVFRLFNLTRDEIRLLQREVEH